jgi:hypothetical protein
MFIFRHGPLIAACRPAEVRLNYLSAKETAEVRFRTISNSKTISSWRGLPCPEPKPVSMGSRSPAQQSGWLPPMGGLGLQGGGRLTVHTTHGQQTFIVD